MKRSILKYIILFGLIFSSAMPLFADFKPEDNLECYSEQAMKYQLAAKFFGYSMKPDKDYATGCCQSDDGISYTSNATPIISYESAYLMAWFSDGLIITYLSGNEEGKQVVIYQGKIIGISYPKANLYKGRISNPYAWGKVDICIHDGTYAAIFFDQSYIPSLFPDLANDDSSGPCCDTGAPACCP